RVAPREGRNGRVKGLRGSPAPPAGPFGPFPASPVERNTMPRFESTNVIINQDMSPLPNGWTTMEEVYAILITNVAMSERGRKQFRKNHQGFAALEPNLSTSVGFLTDPDHLKWVNWLYTRNAVFFRRVGEVQTPFNPIREFIQNSPAWQVVLQTNPK